MSLTRTTRMPATLRFAAGNLRRGGCTREGEEAADAGSGRAQDFPLGPAAALN